MSIGEYIYSARHLLSSILDNCEDSTRVTGSYSAQSIRYRKSYWNIIKASRTLATLSESSYSYTQDINMEEFLPPEDAPATPPSEDTERKTVSFNVANPANFEKAAKSRLYNSLDRPIISHNSVHNNSPSHSSQPTASSAAVDKLSMAGFAAVKDLLLKYQPSNGSPSNRPFLSLGELGVEEGWTTMQTNAAFCYENNPVEGWRKEVAIRRSGKSRGKPDIHYLTPDKSRRFRSRQELQSFLSRTSTSADLINQFDFRSVFCACHRNEDNHRSYLECSYGLAGCNKWVHAECMGLGVRSELELALMPKVICPLCATYLKGTGELDSFISDGTCILPEIVWDALDQTDKHADEIEESGNPHMLWGMQGSPFIYCRESGLSGLTQQFPYRQRSSFPPVNSPGALVSELPSTTPVSSEITEISEHNNFMQHRLFQKWTSIGYNGKKKHNSSAFIAGVEKKKPEKIYEEEIVRSDDDEGVPSNPYKLEPVDLVRRARYSDGSTKFVRVEGGWMSRKNGTGHDKLQGSTAGPTGGSSDEVLLITETESAESLKARILAKAALRSKTVFSVSNRYKNEMIESAANIATTSSRRRLATNSAISAVVAGAANGSITENALNELHASFQLKPALCFLPLEDGGVRFASVSSAQVPRSFHALCATNQLCAVCLTPAINQQNSGEPHSTEKANKKGTKKRRFDVLNPELDRFDFTSVVCGSITYPVHKQCAGAIENPFLFSGVNCQEQEKNDFTWAIALSGVHAYDQVDDAECDLCGRRGGILRYFHIDVGCSGVAAPAEEGWLAHIPCIQFLDRSGWLSPLPAASIENFKVGDHDALSRFQRNPLSFRIAPEVSMGGATNASSESFHGQSQNASNDNDNDNYEHGNVTATFADKVDAMDVCTESEETDERAQKAEHVLACVDSKKNDATRDQDLQFSNKLHPYIPVSIFDQQLGHWRCTLCGLQCGVAMRCMAAGCTVRAHPLCAMTLNSAQWRLCKVSRKSVSSNVRSREVDVAMSGTYDNISGKNNAAVSVGILCPLHSAGMEP